MQGFLLSATVKPLVNEMRDDVRRDVRCDRYEEIFSAANVETWSFAKKNVFQRRLLHESTPAAESKTADLARL